MFDIKTLMQSMTNRLVLVTVLAYFVVEALFAGQRSGLELYFWQSPDFKVWQISHVNISTRRTRAFSL